MFALASLSPSEDLNTDPSSQLLEKSSFQQSDVCSPCLYICFVSIIKEFSDFIEVKQPTFFELNEHTRSRGTSNFHFQGHYN